MNVSAAMAQFSQKEIKKKTSPTFIAFILYIC